MLIRNCFLLITFLNHSGGGRPRGGGGYGGGGDRRNNRDGGFSGPDRNYHGGNRSRPY